MNSDTNKGGSVRDHFRIGLASPINLTALQAVISAVQAIWPEASLGTPKDGESSVLLIPKESFLKSGRIVPQELVSTIREDSKNEEDALTHHSEVTIMAPGAVEMSPPPETLNLLSGYCHALLESLPEGSNAIQQTIYIPERDEPYVLSIQPKSQAETRAPAEWREGAGWVSEKTQDVSKAKEGDQLRRTALQRIASMKNVTRVLSKTTKAQITEALHAD